MRWRGPTTVVAVPARDEAERIGVCLRALLDQREADGRALAPGALRIVVLANNCQDGTASAARAVDPRVDVIEVELAPEHANAGAARRAAMEAANARLPIGGGLICTTDADSRPRPDWIVRLWAALEGGAEAVAGAVDFDIDERPAFSAFRQREGLYSALQAEITARLDPEPHNPWPNHIWAWGANLAVTSGAYHKVGGLAPQALAEDRAFIQRLRLYDVPVRHCLSARVWTSARLEGRAKGGLSTLVRDHLGEDGEPCDAALEPARIAWRRAAWRARLRRIFPERSAPASWARRLAVSPEVLKAAFAKTTFGAAWETVEATSPRLAAPRLVTSELATEIARAERLLGRVRPGGQAVQADSARAATAGLWSARAP